MSGYDRNLISRASEDTPNNPNTKPKAKAAQSCVRQLLFVCGRRSGLEPKVRYFVAQLTTGFDCPGCPVVTTETRQPHTPKRPA